MIDYNNIELTYSIFPLFAIFIRWLAGFFTKFIFKYISKAFIVFGTRALMIVGVVLVITNIFAFYLLASIALHDYFSTMDQLYTISLPTILMSIGLTDFIVDVVAFLVSDIILLMSIASNFMIYKLGLSLWQARKV